MASFNDITISTSEYRPCFVDGEKALFHRWVVISEIIPPSMLRGGHNGGNVTETFALVEFENGEIRLSHPRQIRFCPSGKFNEYSWE